jgi:hypothetical protein
LPGSGSAAPEADRLLSAAAAHVAAIDVPCEEAVVLLEHGEWLMRIGRADEGVRLIGQARETFEDLRAIPWLERAVAASAVAV